MEQPPGYINPRLPDHVCCLRKALYRLKQAPHAWFSRFSAYLTQLGFRCSQFDTSLFIYTRGPTLFNLLVYVDDIIVIGNDPDLLPSFIQ